MAGTLKDLVWQKEKEWRDLVDGRIVELETENQEKSNELVKLTEVFERLKADFKYNLHLLKQRDAELAEFELQTNLLRQQLDSKQEECSRLALAVDDKHQEVETEQATKLEIQSELQRCLTDRQMELDSCRREADDEVRGLREELAETRRNAKLEIVRLTSELDRQKHQLLDDVQSTLKQKDSQIHHKSEELNTRVQSSELKCNLLEKELKAVKESRLRAEEDFSHKNTQVCSLELALQEMQTKFQSELSIRTSEVEQLHQQLREQKQKTTGQAAEFARKFRQLDAVIKDREHSLSKLKASLDQDQEKDKGRLNTLQEQLDKEVKAKQELEWKLTEDLKAKTWENDRLTSEMEVLKGKIDCLQRDRTTNAQQQEEEIRDVKIEGDRLREELRKRSSEISRLHQEVEKALENESLAERDRLQSDLQWQRKTEEAELSQVNRMDALIKQLSNSAEQSRARLTLVEKTLVEKDALIKSLRAGSVPTLPMPPSSFTGDADRLQMRVQALEDQNNSLKGVIAQMTDEMARHVSETGQVQEKSSKFDSHAIQTAAGYTDDSVKKNKYITEVVNSSNQLRQERIELIAQCRRQQTRIQNLEGRGEELLKEIRNRDTNLEKVNYEMGALQRQSATEMDSLRKRVAELEMQLSESFTELGEYCKGNIELTRLNEELQKEVSIARTKEATPSFSTPHVNFGAQEITIQHLQDEVERLRDLLADQPQTSGDTSAKGGSTVQSEIIEQLRDKLKKAAHQIQKLACEKQVLIELSNRLRSECKAAGVAKQSSPALAYLRKNPPQKHTAPGQGDSPCKPAADIKAPGLRTNPIAQTMTDVDNKLVELEKLQYEISRKKITDDVVSARDYPRLPRDQEGMSARKLNNDSVSTSLAADNLEEVFTLLNEPANLSDSVGSVGDHQSFGPARKLDSHQQPRVVRGGSVAPQLQIRGDSIHQRNVAMDRLIFTKRK